METFWNGEPCQAERGTGVMLESPQFPFFWGKTAGLIGQRVPVVKVTYDGRTFYIFNEGSEGWDKITVGHGMWTAGHRDLDVEKYVPDEVG